jgi:hypothetical protein
MIVSGISMWTEPAPQNRAVQLLLAAVLFAVVIVPIGLVAYLFLRFVPVELDQQAAQRKALFGSSLPKRVDAPLRPLHPDRYTTAEGEERLPGDGP